MARWWSSPRPFGKTTRVGLGLPKQGALPIALLLGALSGACAERDLSPERFACSAGGPCPARDGGEANGDGGATDSGTPPPPPCVGDYSGSFQLQVGGVIGDATGTFEANRRLTLVLAEAADPITARALVDEDGLLTSTDRFLLDGLLDFEDCTGSGTFKLDPTLPGTWQVTKLP